MFSKVTRPSIFDKKQSEIVQESINQDGPRGKVLFEYGNPSGNYTPKIQYAADGSNRALGFAGQRKDRF